MPESVQALAELSRVPVSGCRQNTPSASVRPHSRPNPWSQALSKPIWSVTPPLSFQSINHIQGEIISPLINKLSLKEFRPLVLTCNGMMLPPVLEIFTLRDLVIFLVASASVSYLLFN
jgi:hypothetical protein